MDIYMAVFAFVKKTFEIFETKATTVKSLSSPEALSSIFHIFCSQKQLSFLDQPVHSQVKKSELSAYFQANQSTMHISKQHS
jgi:hypothetical protein